MKAKIFAGVLIAISSICFSGCQKDEGMLLVQDDPDSRPSPGITEVAVHMTNNSHPGTRLQQVNVDIVVVRVQMSTGEWVDLPTKAGIYDLLALQNGVSTAIVNPSGATAGEIIDMRLVIGSRNSVVVGDGSVFPLHVIGGREHRVKMPGTSIVARDGHSVRILIDFNAQRSLMRSDDLTTYKMEPRIKVMEYSSQPAQ